MTKPEHLLTIVEPTHGGDTTLDLAHEAVARGGTATVLMVITERVRARHQVLRRVRRTGRW